MTRFVPTTPAVFDSTLRKGTSRLPGKGNVSFSCVKGHELFGRLVRSRPGCDGGTYGEVGTASVPGLVPVERSCSRVKRNELWPSRTVSSWRRWTIYPSRAVLGTEQQSMTVPSGMDNFHGCCISSHFSFVPRYNVRPWVVCSCSFLSFHKKSTRHFVHEK